ncbi:hypothetical protein CDD81_1328 [Ophiocordyceps australis]|uniref:Lysine-specific metallo-endopeptidase domain-containing protein n=1 Tax=Ophiocordyceps australis TaxID=1399860 RepID=A0A2C5Y000_9HYPO|nr:hypothetical protein CDD81_1328 [Ophiocordyceps australis]
MRSLIQVLMAILIASAVASLHIRHDLESGIYTAHLDNNATLLVKRSVARHPPPGKTFDEHVPLPKSSSKCRGRFRRFKMSQYQIASDALFNTRLSALAPRAALFSLHGNSVVYACNFLTEWNSASLLEFSEAMAKLDDKCGDTASGVVKVTKLAKWYGRDVRGYQICHFDNPEKHPFQGLDNSELRRAAEKCDSYVRKSCSTWDTGPIR